eukprot:s793_g5.t1
MLDSSAVFESRAEEIGWSADEVRRAKALNVDTFGKFAFSANYVPGQPDESDLMALISKICGTDPAPRERVPLVRRLYYEAYTMANADLRSRLEKRDDEAPRKLAQAERASRHADQVRRLAGLDLTGELEPSHLLVDLVFQMVEENQLRYIRWEQCTKRDQELMGIKVDPTWKPDSQGIIREVRVQEEIKADTSSDLRLRYALQRRSLAMDQSRLCSYEKLEKWSSILLESYSKTPIAGYQKISIEQIQHADMEMWKYLVKNTRGGIRPTAGSAPIDDALDVALTLPEIRLHLQPLPSGSKRRAEGDDNDEKPSSAKKAKVSSSDQEKMQRTIENLQGQLRNLKKGKGFGKSKGKKGQAPSAKYAVRMPSELIGQNAMTESNEPICFSYNLKGCSGAGPNGKCAKGRHVCTKCGGFQVLAVDQRSNRRQQEHPTVALDLTNDEAVNYILSLLTKPGVVLYLHAAPPFGTARRARATQLSARRRALGLKARRPLRSAAHPHGLPSLQGADLRRVRAANLIYRNVCRIAAAAVQAGCLVSIESHTRSWMWETDYFKDLLTMHR